MVTGRRPIGPARGGHGITTRGNGFQGPESHLVSTLAIAAILGLWAAAPPTGV